MMSLTPFLALALLGQNVAPIRVAPETLAWLRRDPSTGTLLAEALQGRAATAATLSPDQSARLASPDVAARELAGSRERATRQLKAGLVAAKGASTLLSAGGKPMVRTILATGDALYDFSLTSGLLARVSFEQGFEDEKDAMKALSMVVLSKLRIPESARSPVTGSLRKVPLANGRWIWGGPLEFGHAPDADGVYHISEPKWHDHINVWTDGEVMFMRYGRDDTVMNAANANPPKPGR